MSTESPSDDLVSRLRLYGTRTPDEAADRIEALEATLERRQKSITAIARSAERWKAERDAEAALADQLAAELLDAQTHFETEWGTSPALSAWRSARDSEETT